MRILFDSKQTQFKSPFGTLTPGQRCKLSIHVPSAVQATRVVCLVQRENGEPYGVPVVLSEENGWHFLWEELPLRVGGETFEYSVRETKVKDYLADLSVSTDENGTTCFTLKNTWTPEYGVLALTKRDFADPETLLCGAGFELYLKVDAGTENAVYVPGTVDGYGILWAEFTTDENGSFTVENLPVCESLVQSLRETFKEGLVVHIEVFVPNNLRSS